jgi:hypothetical protein
MENKKRIFIVLGILVLLILAVVGIEYLRGKSLVQQIDASLEPGDIPVYWNGTIKAAFSPADLERLPTASFVDAEEGKTQEGWYLRDALLTQFDENLFAETTIVQISSTSREKSIALTWTEVNDLSNMVLFDLSGKGTLKLVSLLERLDIRDEWIQDVDKVEIKTR